MCLYDDMRVQVSPVLTISIIKQNIHYKNRQNIFQKNILKILGVLRLWTIFALLLNPVYAIPLKRIAHLQTKGTHRQLYKEGIGIQIANTKSIDRDYLLHLDRVNNYSPKISESSEKNILSSVSSLGGSFKRNQISLSLKMDSTDLAGRSRRSSGGENTCGGESSLDHETSQGSWMEPCSNHNLMEGGSATQQDLSLHIMKAIVEANSQVENFINHFSNQAFGVSWKDATDHSAYMLEFLNASSGIDLNEGTTSFEDTLQEAYEIMQRRAVGIEQVTLDQALYQSSCLSRFRHLERRIIGILCQLRHAMMNKQVVPRENVTKNIMPESARSLESEQSRNIRDAVILREYIDSLHLLHSVFNNFSQK